jgi:hypothetical protein
MINEKKVIQQLHERKYEPGENFVLTDYAFKYGSPLDLLMYSKILWPDFIEIEDMVFSSIIIEDEDDKQKALDYFIECEGDKQKTEQSFNMIEIPSSLFGKNANEANAEIFLMIANLLCEMWLSRLSILYPSRKFRFRILAPEETGDELAIMFYQT